jgi:hypothetical protein
VVDRIPIPKLQVIDSEGQAMIIRIRVIIIGYKLRFAVIVCAKNRISIIAGKTSCQIRIKGITGDPGSVRIISIRGIHCYRWQDTLGQEHATAVTQSGIPIIAVIILLIKITHYTAAYQTGTSIPGIINNRRVAVHIS